MRNHRKNFRKDLRNSTPSDEEFNNFINNYMSYEKKKIDLRANLISELKEVMSLRKTYMLFRYEDDFRREMMEKLRESQNNKKN